MFYFKSGVERLILSAAGDPDFSLQSYLLLGKDNM